MTPARKRTLFYSKHSNDYSPDEPFSTVSELIPVYTNSPVNTGHMDTCSQWACGTLTAW